MRALVVEEFAPYETHTIKELADPEPGAGEVIIDTRAMSVNFPDVLMVEGLYQHKPERPFIPGFDASGVVAALGEGVTDLSIGDRVLTSRHYGAFCTRVAAPADHVYRMPDTMSFEEGAAFALVYLTAYISMIANAKAQAGETVLVTGASGGVGLAMVQFGCAEGMTMLGGVTSPEKAQLVKANGAAHAIDLAADDLQNALREQVYAVTGGKGVDLVMDPVGGDAFDASLRAIKPGGRVAVVGFASGRIPEVKVNYLLVKRLSVIGSPLSASRKDAVALRAAAMAHMFELYERGKLRPHISATLPFDDWQEGFRRFRDREVVGKIVLTP